MLSLLRRSVWALSSLSVLAACTGSGGGFCPQAVQTSGDSGTFQGTATFTVPPTPEVTGSTSCSGGFSAGVDKAGSFDLSCSTPSSYTLTLSGSVEAVGALPVGTSSAQQPVTVGLSSACNGSVLANVSVDITERAGGTVEDAGAQTVTSDFHVKGVLHVDVAQPQTLGDAGACTLTAEQIAIPFELGAQNACAGE